MAEHSLQRPLIAVVGGNTLLAREIRELLADSKPSPRLQLISAAADDSMLLSADDEEPVVLPPLSAQSLEGASIAFLAGSAASSRRALKLTPPGGPRLIDLTGSLEQRPNARLRAPSAEPAPVLPAESAIQVVAHPAAIAIAMLLGSLVKAGAIRRSIVHVFEPASERGQQGLEELRQQTVAVLSFQKLKDEVFDAQLSFNLLARYGEEALEPLESVEQRMERHVASLLASRPGVPMPSLRLIQAPVFHGHSFSVWVEFEENPGVQALAAAFAASGFEVRSEDPPTNAGIAGQSGLAVGAISTDRNHPRACWFWAVADNLRLAAENAVAIAREVL